ncbi:MAG: BatD family protein [Longimicrobiales bacterium]|nr:BatD family protein [Longimicrobiales bacterium]
MRRAATVPRALRPASVMLAVAVCVGTLTTAGAVSAQEPAVRAYLTPGNTVPTGGSFTLNVEVSGTQDVQRDPQLPDLSAFAQLLGSSTQSSVQMINGRTTVSLTLQYRFQALAEGSHTIPSFSIQAGGETLSTQPLQLTVSADAAPTRSPDSPVGPDDLFITAEPSKRTVYVGEPLILEYRIWTRVDVSSFGMTRVPEPAGFWVEDVTQPGQPRIEERTRNGTSYTTAVIRRVALVPTGSGQRTIEPIGVEAQVRVRQRRDPFEDFFGRGFPLGSRAVQTTVLANPVTIDVQPLPPGAPQPFSGVVGTLEISAELDRDSVVSNDAVTLTVSVAGTGHVTSIPAPELGLASDFEVFPPEVSESFRISGSGLSGNKTFEYVLIPRAPGAREIPSIRIPYFDDAVGEYRVATTQPLSLTVSGNALQAPGSLGRGGVAQLREDIRFIRLGPLQLRRVGGSLFEAEAFWLLFLLPLAAVGGAMVLRRHQDRLEGDVAYARGRRAGRVARKRLARARELMDSDDARGFYAEVARALRGLVADRLNLAEAGLRTAELDQALAETGIDDEVRRELVACLEECDRQRFAPPSADPEARGRFLDRAGEVMTALDRGVR